MPGNAFCSYHYSLSYSESKWTQNRKEINIQTFRHCWQVTLHGTRTQSERKRSSSSPLGHDLFVLVSPVPSTVLGGGAQCLLNKQGTKKIKLQSGERGKVSRWRKSTKSPVSTRSTRLTLTYLYNSNEGPTFYWETTVAGEIKPSPSPCERSRKYPAPPTEPLPWILARLATTGRKKKKIP